MLSISSFKAFNKNEIDYLYANDTKMSISQIVSHIEILSTGSTKNDLQEISQSLEKIKANLERQRPNRTLKKTITIYLSSRFNLNQGFGFRDSLTLVTETLTKVRAAVDIKSKIEAKRYPELIEYFNSHPEELVKNRGLIKTHFDSEILPLLLDKLSTKDLTGVLAENALPEEAFKKLSKSQILRLCPLLSDLDFLPPYAQNFKQILEHPAQGIKDIQGLVGLNDEEKDAAIAHYIEHRIVSIKNIKQTLNDEEILRLAPHLRYVDLRDFADMPLAKELLQKCTNLNALLINHERMLEGVSTLPFCEMLDCYSCTRLQALPALPLCKELICSSCSDLQTLPALPLCEKLYCHYCTRLQALPALPLCKDLFAHECTSLQAMLALPLCENLNCNGCTGLKALPALPRCEMLNCFYCTGLKALPALPLCKGLICSHCAGLQALPALPLCEALDCNGCIGLTELPALPLCSSLDCSGCENLTTLPLSLGQNPELTTINLLVTRIDPAIRDAILNLCRRRRNADAPNILPLRLAKWKAIAKSGGDLDVSTLSDEQKMILNEWLVRLERTQDFFRSQALLAQTVYNLIADLVQNKEFQELFFSQAEANNACCGDRAAMSLNEIYTSWKIICTPGTLPLSVMTGIAKTLRLRKELQKLIKGDESESVEIFLYYESTLRERLKLVTAIQNMIYSQIGIRSWIDKEKLVEDVEANFFEELIELPVFEKMIVVDNLKFSTKLEELGECPAGGPNDPQVLNYQHRQGEIMQEWKREKIRAAKKLI